MVRLKIFETNYCNIYFDEDEEVLFSKWSGFLQHDQVMRGCRAMTHYIAKHKIKRHLCDHTDLTVLSREVKKYLTREWFIEAENLGLEKIGMVVSKNAFGKAPEDEENHETQLGKLKIFTSTSELNCMKWLKEI